MKIARLLILVTLSLSFHFINAINAFSKSSSKAIEDGKVTKYDTMDIFRDPADTRMVLCSDLKLNLKSFCQDIPAGSNVFCGCNRRLILCKGTCVSATADDPTRTFLCQPYEVAQRNPEFYKSCVAACKARCPSSIGHLVCVDKKCSTANSKATTLDAATHDEFIRDTEDCKEAVCCCDFKSAK